MGNSQQLQQLQLTSIPSNNSRKIFALCLAKSRVALPYGPDVATYIVKEFNLQNPTGEVNGSVNSRRVDGSNKRQRIYETSRTERIKECGLKTVLT